MSISEKLERRAARPPLPNPEDPRPGYSQPDAVDPSGYSLSDPSGRTGDGEVSDVSPPRLSPVVGRLTDATYGDDTVRPVPGGALGEAGAAWTDQDFGSAVGLTRQHAIRPVELGEAQGFTPAHAWRAVPDVYSEPDERPGVYPGYSGRSERRLTDASLEYTADRDSKPRSDADVFGDVYGPGARGGREDAGGD